MIHDFNDFNRTESSCCIRTCSDGGIRLNDLSLLIRLVLSPLPEMISADSCADGAGPFFPLCTHLVVHFLHPLSIWLCCSLTLCLLTKCTIMLSALFSSANSLRQIYQCDAERQRIQSSRSGMRMRQFAWPGGSGFRS